MFNFVLSLGRDHILGRYSMGNRRRRRTRKRKRKAAVAGAITLSRADGEQIRVQYSDTDSVMTIKKRIHAETGKWYDICSVRTDGGSPPVCAGANRHNSLYRTLRSAGVAPRAGFELYLRPASGPGGASPVRDVTRKRFSHLPCPSKSKSKSRSKRVEFQLPSTTNQNRIRTLGVILSLLEDEALRLEAHGMDQDIETLRLRQMREEEPDEDEIAEVRSNGFRDVRRKLDERLVAILRHGIDEDDHLRRPMWLPQGVMAFRWLGGYLNLRERRKWHEILRGYLEQGEVELMDLSPAEEERWRWSSYLRSLHKSLCPDA